MNKILINRNEVNRRMLLIQKKVRIGFVNFLVLAILANVFLETLFRVSR